MSYFIRNLIFKFYLYFFIRNNFICDFKRNLRYIFFEAFNSSLKNLVSSSPFILFILNNSISNGDKFFNVIKPLSYALKLLDL